MMMMMTSCMFVNAVYEVLMQLCAAPVFQQNWSSGMSCVTVLQVPCGLRINTVSDAEQCFNICISGDVAIRYGIQFIAYMHLLLPVAVDVVMSESKSQKAEDGSQHCSLAIGGSNTLTTAANACMSTVN